MNVQLDPHKCGIKPGPRKVHDVAALQARVRRELLAPTKRRGSP